MNIARMCNWMGMICAVSICAAWFLTPATAENSLIREAVLQEAGQRDITSTNLGHDVVTCDMTGPVKWGVAGGIAAYSIGMRIGNNGTENINTFSGTTDNVLAGQNIYRLKDGRLEQMGMSWSLNDFCALQQSMPSCVTGCDGPNGCPQFLTPGCTSPHTASSAGGVSRILSPHSDVNAWTGEFPFPATPADESVSETIRRRIQVRIEDLDPILNPGAVYFGEVIHVYPDDAQDGNHYNNAAWKQVNVGAMGGDGAPFLSFGSNPVHTQQEAIFAWQDMDPEVVIVAIDIPGEGRFHVGYRVTDNGDNTWHYEYAIYNLNSDRSLRSMTLPLLPDVVPVNIGFHDVDYHSGDGIGGVNFDGADWPASFVDGQTLTWATDTFEQNENANALRWGTMYNYRFDANAAPASGLMTLGLFKPGTPGLITASVRVPGEALTQSCAGNLECDDGDDCTTDLCIASSCTFPARLFADANNDGAGNILDVICSARVIFQGTTVCGAHDVSFDEIDIAPSASCGDEALNIVDLVVHARAIFQDAIDECCGG